jgi:hypothetical protein
LKIEWSLFPDGASEFRLAEKYSNHFNTHYGSAAGKFDLGAANRWFFNVGHRKM